MLPAFLLEQCLPEYRWHGNKIPTYGDYFLCHPTEVAQVAILMYTSCHPTIRDISLKESLKRSMSPAERNILALYASVGVTTGELASTCISDET